ncbi:EAL domain-containing protein [Lautropia mirabilis]|uniref:EAL domain-containing protein n=1 Tax=Lautropia mirabilis TaxID=47671 RepID=UPI0028F0C858|nr:EAL domain-containing protein [Lautropia mirabilis]
MQIAGLTFKPLAQWSRHALLTTWSFCVLALLMLALRESSLPPQQDGMMNTAILLVQSLALLPVTGLLHWMFINPHSDIASQAAGAASRKDELTWLIRYLPPLSIALGCALPCLPGHWANVLATAIAGLLLVMLMVEIVVTLRKHPGLESRLGVTGALLCGMVLSISFIQRTWAYPLLDTSWLQMMMGTGLMVWIAGFFRQAARRENRLKTNLVQMDTAARALHRIYNTSPVALLSINADGTLQRWNQRAADAFGGDLARQPAPHINALLGTAVSQQLLADLGKSGHYHSELTLTRAGQDRVWVLEAGIRDGGGFEIGMHEVTAHARRAATFQEIAERDEMTGLPNLVGLRRILGKQLSQLRASSPLSCVYVDILEFGDINHVFGRDAGDAVLRAVAEHLSKQISPPAAVGRVRDDQFLLVLPGNELTLTRTQATLLLTMLSRTPVEYRGMSIPLQVSIGAVECVAGMNAEQLIESARLACQLSRQEGAPHPYAVMADSPALADADPSRQFGHQLRQKLPEAQIRLHAQAVTSLRRDAVQSLTVLPRLLTSNGQLQLPNRLLQAAAQQGASGMLDRMLLTQILHTLNTQPNTLPEDGVVIFRLSPLSLAEPGFTGNLIRLLGAADERNAAINSRLCIELSSQSLIYDPEGSQAFLKDLRLMSIHSGIDLTDSESSQIPIHMLAQLSVRHIRLDGRRFADLATNPHAQREITAVRALCESMGIECLLDQVNNPLDLRPLKELGIDLVQGSALTAVRPLGDVLAGREEEGLLPAGVMIPV